MRYCSVNEEAARVKIWSREEGACYGERTATAVLPWFVLTLMVVATRRCRFVVLQGVEALPLLLCASMVDMVGVVGATMEFAQICSSEDDVAVAVLVAAEMKKCDGDGARCLPARSVNGREWWPTVAMVMVDALDGR